MKHFLLQSASQATCRFILGTLGLLPITLGAITQFQLDPARSAISMSGTVVALNQSLTLLEQGPGSLTATYTGTLRADLQPNSIEFLGGTLVSPVETNSWQPGLAGAAGQALASYGAKASIQVVIFSANAVAASRGIVFQGRSIPLPLSAGSFPAGGLVIQFKDSTNSVVDYRVTGALSVNGSKVLGGLLTNNVVKLGSISTVSGVQTLTLPINSSYSFSLDSTLGPVIYNLTFTGQLVATQGAIEIDPIIAFEPVASPGGPLVLKFPNEKFKLQRTPGLNPPTWTDVSAPSPVSLPTSQPGEYFRVVPK